MLQFFPLFFFVVVVLVFQNSPYDFGSLTYFSRDFLIVCNCIAEVWTMETFTTYIDEIVVSYRFTRKDFNTFLVMMRERKTYVGTYQLN